VPDSPDLLTADLAAAGDVSASASPALGRAATGSRFGTYLATKLLAAVISLAVTLVIAFVLFSIIPSDPVRTLTQGRPVSAGQLATLRKELGVGRPIYSQFWHFLDNVFHLNLGYSYQFQEPVSTMIAQRIGPTLLLMGVSTVISIVVGLWLGIRSGWRHGSLLDRIASGTSITLWSVPTFWLGIILLVVFSVGIGPIHGVFPAGGMESANFHGSELGRALNVVWHLVLPTLTLVLVIFAQYVTIMRSSIIDELGSAYLLTARAKGLRDEEVRRRHAVPNALLPSVTLIFLQLGGMVSGAITVEVVFSWPGLGYLTYQALQIPDIQLLEGTFIFFSASVIFMNVLADIVYRLLDPRVRAQ
jgi:peptide/nickel transport system permease protein